MPARTMSLFRLVEWVNTFVGKAMGGANAVRLLDETLTVPKSTCRYSTFADHGPPKAYSAPTPATQPVLVCEREALSAAVANVSLKRKFALRSVTARPPVA